MTSDGDAAVVPNQAWSEDGAAEVAPIPPFPELTPRTLPLEHHAPSTHTVRRENYPGGLVLVPSGGGPVITPATLPIKSSSGNTIVVTGDNYTDWPDGFVLWFLTQ
jgi:hypothetical protein